MAVGLVVEPADGVEPVARWCPRAAFLLVVWIVLSSLSAAAATVPMSTGCGGRFSLFLGAAGAGTADVPCAPDAAVDPAAGCGAA